MNLMKKKYHKVMNTVIEFIRKLGESESVLDDLKRNYSKYTR